MKKELANALNTLKAELILKSSELNHPPAISIFTGSLAEEIAIQLADEGIQPEATTAVDGLVLRWNRGEEGTTTRTGVELREGDVVITTYLDPMSENVDPSTVDEEGQKPDPNERACVVLFRQRVEELKRVAGIVSWELGNVAERYQDDEINWGHVGSLDMISGGLAQALESLKDLAEDDEDDEDEWRNEQAREAGMLHGVEAYNEAQGYDSEPVED